MNPIITTIKSKKIMGMHMSTTLAQNNAHILWKNFMPRRNEIKNKSDTNLISMQVYEQIPNVSIYNPEVKFERWAAVEVTDFSAVPDKMDTYIMRGGLYAVFLHKGGPSTGLETFRYIFGTWLPGSGYTLDDREHFELLGEKYKNDDPHSEEEIWIPVITK
jgi:AraC family transcriptional regulator